MPKLRLISLAALLLTSVLTLQAQKSIRPGCGFDDLHEQQVQDALFRQKEELLNQKIRSSVLQKQLERNKRSLVKSQPTIVYTIPVVFHIVNSDPNSITDLMIIQALNELNDAFAFRNAYQVEPNGADTKIQFCLAKTDPYGGRTNGIERISSYYENIDVDMESGELPALSNWDPAKYANIWVVNSIQGEIPPTVFECGKWKRSGYGGYASAGGGVVVAGLSVPLLAHEMGHYLSLLHTFQGTDCRNNDCTTDGDLVCDTPPDRSTATSPCNSPDNSCNTDTLSGPFTSDVPDNIANFMDYGSACPSMFTQGQADRMRAFLENFNGGSLITSDRCNIPCSENIVTNFDWFANPHPKIGSPVPFKNNTTGALNYRWYINDVLVDSSTDLTHTFNVAGKYTIKLKAYNLDSNCYGSYTGNVWVNCGVASRFSPDKRIIASKIGLLEDSVFFWNKSYGANAYKWYITNPSGNKTMVGTQQDLLYKFPQPGIYSIQLEATNGSCTELSPVYRLTVLDPITDAITFLHEVDCYKKDSIRITFSVYNNGYDTIPAGLPFKFYDRDPSLPGALELKNSFMLPDSILGKCSSRLYTHVVSAMGRKPDTLVVVFDPSNTLRENNTANNQASKTLFQFRIRIQPSDTTVYVNSDLALQLATRPTTATLYKWTSSGNLNCSDCARPILTVTDTSWVKTYAENPYGCGDSTQTMVYVFPNDLLIRAKNVYCYRNENLLVESEVCLGNGYKALKKEVEVTYYDKDPSIAGAKLLGTGIISVNTNFNNGCSMISHVIAKTLTGKAYLYINEKRDPFEVNLSNNIDSIDYTPFSIRVPLDSWWVYRNDPVTLSFINGGEPYRSILWSPANKLSCTTCPNPILDTRTNTLIKVVGTSQYDCTDSATIDAKIYYRSYLALPNAFTPDGDGLNDWFYVIAGAQVTLVKNLQIFNRWGEKVFERSNAKPNDLSAGWDGSYKGQKAPQGTYVYVVVLQLQDGKTDTQKGTITLLR
ncbi:MAG: hypothetical protein RJB03_1579 [Bacteroidota bacterium]|jgi:gliding motility-associated-like protein